MASSSVSVAASLDSTCSSTLDSVSGATEECAPSLLSSDSESLSMKLESLDSGFSMGGSLDLHSASLLPVLLQALDLQ